MRFLRGLAARTALLAAAIVGLNLVVDPLGLYGSRVLEPIGSQTQRDKLLLFEQAQPTPAVVVLGSSRSFYVEPAHIRARTSLPAFNAATSGAGAGDYLDFARCFDARGRFPSVLIVAVGVEQAVSAWRTNERNDLMEACLRPDKPLADRLRTYRGTFSRQETWASLRLLALEVTGRPDPAFSFGSRGEVTRTREPPGTLDAMLDASLAGAWGPQGFASDRLSDESMGHLRQTLELCRHKGAQALLYIPPYHPRAVALYKKESRFESGRARLLERMASWAAEYPVRYHDFSEIDRFGGREDMFTDASHPTAEADRMMLDIMLAPAH